MTLRAHSVSPLPCLASASLSHAVRQATLSYEVCCPHRKVQLRIRLEGSAMTCQEVLSCPQTPLPLWPMTPVYRPEF